MAQLGHLAGQMSFLTDAAHLLAKSAPETSAYLMSQRNALLLSHDLPLSDVKRQHACTSCGHIMIPGHGDALRVEAAKVARPKKDGDALRRAPGTKAAKLPAAPAAATASTTVAGPGSSGAAKEKEGSFKIYTCSMCHKYTRVALPPPPAIVRRKRKPATVGASQPPSSAPSITTGSPGIEKPQPSANSNSKKRAKSRKAGLQALLSQAQKDSVKKPGLSLADFMKR
jgi:hypothetical protein